MVGLGSDQVEKWPKPKRDSDLASGSRPKSGPNPSEKAVLGRGRFHNVFVLFLLLFRLMVGCEALGAYVGALGPLLGPMLAVLGPMLAVLGRSWAYVGGLGSGSGPKLAVLGPKWSVLEAIRAKSGPNPSGKAIWQADQGGKAAQTRARRPFWGGDGFTMFSVAGPPCQFFL